MMLSFKLKSDTVAYSGIQQFNKAEAVTWLDGEERLALAIASDASDRDLSREANAALIRVEACAQLRSKIRWDGFTSWLTRKRNAALDLEVELGNIQQALTEVK